MTKETAAHVEIELDGETYVLKPTLRAAQQLSRMHGGFLNTFEGIRTYRLDVYAQIIAIGSGATEAKDLARIESQVYSVGMQSLAGDLDRYVNLVMNGGRTPEQIAAAQAEVAERGGKA